MKKFLLLSLAFLAFACSKDDNFDSDSLKGDWLVTSLKANYFEEGIEEDSEWERNDEVDIFHVNEILTIKNNEIIPCRSVDEQMTELFSNTYKGSFECSLDKTTITLPETTYSNTVDGVDYQREYQKRTYKYTITGDVMQLSLSTKETTPRGNISIDVEIVLKRQ
ncbi:MAG: hypothetical protein K6E51_11405 [Treponema sp.]|nr:hypothetical protein [Treponema sp.]